MLLVLYPVSYGPWLWLFPQRQFENSAIAEVGNVAYGPLDEVFYRVPDWIADPYVTYLTWWNADDAGWVQMGRIITRAVWESPLD